MGTNFYLTKPCPAPCTHCAGADREHIGKSSGGWVFLFNGTVRHTTAAWRKRIKEALADGYALQDEYGGDVMPKAFWAMVKAKKTEKSQQAIFQRENMSAWTDDGNDFIENNFS